MWFVMEIHNAILDSDRRTIIHNLNLNRLGGLIEDRFGLCVVWEVPSSVWVSVWD